MANGDLEFGFRIIDPREKAREKKERSNRNAFAAISSAKVSLASLPEIDLNELDEDNEPTDKKEYGWMEVELSANDLLKMDSKAGRFIFEKNGITVILNRMQTRTFNFDAF